VPQKIIMAITLYPIVRKRFYMILEKLESIPKMFSVQDKKYRETLYATDTVPAGESKLQKINTSNVGDFLVLYITGSFTTLRVVDEHIVDVGISFLSAQLKDGNSQTLLFNDFIDMQLWVSPGRVKSVLSNSLSTDPPAGYFLYPLEFEYLFSKNSDILIDVKNTGNTPNTWKLAFHGLRYR